MRIRNNKKLIQLLLAKAEELQEHKKQIRDTLHTRVRHPIRLWAKENYEKNKEIYKKNRFRVEQVIGIVKNWFGDRDCVKEFHTASLHVLARFILYNLILLYKLLLFFVSFWRVGLLLVFLSLGIFLNRFI